MNWAKAKPRTVLFYIIGCFYTSFPCWPLLHLHDGSRLKKQKQARFQINVPVFVKPCLTLFSFSSSFSRFLNLFHQFFPRYTTYDIRYTLLKLPPILHANHPILCGSHPILHGSHPILRGNHPRLLGFGLQASDLGGGQAFRPVNLLKCTVHCLLLMHVKR